MATKPKVSPVPVEHVRTPLLLPQDGIIYDSEIMRLIPDSREERDEAYDYCNGWGDYLGMGVACVCAFDLWTRMPHVFLRDNLGDFQDLVNSREYVIGFNSQKFDDNLLAAHGVKVKSTYDLHCEYKIAMGYNRNSRIKGSGLDKISRVNFGMGKTEHGHSTPKLWQDGQHGRVINYCMNDVMMTLKILLRGHKLISTVDEKEIAPLRGLFEAKHEGQNVRMSF